MNKWQRLLLSYLRQRRHVMKYVSTKDLVDETHLNNLFRTALSSVPTEYMEALESFMARMDDRWAEFWALKEMKNSNPPWTADFTK